MLGRYSGLLREIISEGKNFSCTSDIQMIRLNVNRHMKGCVIDQYFFPKVKS